MKPALVLAVLLPCVGAAQAEVREYADTPLTVLLPLGKERQLSFDGSSTIRIGMPAELRTRLDVESAGPHVWLRAHEPLTAERVYLETENQLYILLLQTAEQAPLHPLRIRRRSAQVEAENPPAVDYVSLARYAVQSLYTPEAQAISVPGIRQLALPAPPANLFRCRTQMPAACGGAVDVTPHTAWQAPPFYATALTVRNLLPQPLELDPRDVRGQFAAAVIVHPRLAAAGDPKDTTALVLISDVPFARALR